MTTFGSIVARVFMALAFALAAAGAGAQTADDPAADIYSQGLVAPSLDAGMGAPANTLAAPQVTPAPAPAQPALNAAAATGRHHQLILEARLVADGAPLTEGIIWRVFSTVPDADGNLAMVAQTKPSGTVAVELTPGDYMVHAAFGRAGATRRVTVVNADQTQSLVLDAGGLKLESVVGDGRPIPPDQLTLEVQQQDGEGDFITLVADAEPGRILRLSAGTYHVVSHYGNINAVVNADIEVKAGKLTEAVMRHTGAAVTLKLVAVAGGEALANTSWSVTTQDGIQVHESVGAFPSIVLAAGTYTAVARHQDEMYSRDFNVETGIDRDVEVSLSDLVQPETGPAAAPPLDADQPLAADSDTVAPTDSGSTVTIGGDTTPTDEVPTDQVPLDPGNAEQDSD